MDRLANAIGFLSLAVLMHGCLTSGKGVMNTYPLTEEAHHG